MAQAKKGLGVLLKRGNGGGPEVFTSIAEVKNVDGPNVALDPLDATHSESPGGWREFVAGLKDGGEVALTCAFLMDSTQNLAAGILKDLNDGVLRNFQVVWPTPTPATCAFAALVVGWAPKVTIDSVMTVDIKLKISGAITVT